MTFGLGQVESQVLEFIREHSTTVEDIAVELAKEEGWDVDSWEDMKEYPRGKAIEIASKAAKKMYGEE